MQGSDIIAVVALTAFDRQWRNACSEAAVRPRRPRFATFVALLVCRAAAN